MSHFVSSKKQLKHITNHNKYTAKQDIIKKITYCCHEQNVQITIGNSMAPHVWFELSGQMPVAIAKTAHCAVS